MSMLKLFTALRSRPRSSSVRGLTADDAGVLNDYDLLPSGRKGGLMMELCVHQPVLGVKVGSDVAIAIKHLAFDTHRLTV